MKAGQEANHPSNHEAESDEVELTSVFSETLSLVRVEVEEHEQKETGNPAGRPKGLSEKVWADARRRTYRLTQKHHLQDK